MTMIATSTNDNARRAPVSPSLPSYVQQHYIEPRNRLDTRMAPYCRRCGAYGEPDDASCWKCGGEEMLAHCQ